MFSHIKNGTVSMTGSDMDYIRFGRGERILIMLPGLGDGLTTVKGTALPMALMYWAYAKDYTVYMFSRRNHMPVSSSTRDMAHDLKEAMDMLGIACADIVGVSMGGMIAQHFAADYPDRVGRLVLVVTSAGKDAVLGDSIREWTECANRGDHTALMDSNVRRMYTDTYYRRNRWLVPIISRFTKPKSYDRFLIQADACLHHFATDRLPLIKAPTLVIGGEQDRALSPSSSHEIAAAIPGAQLIMYPGYGHALYEEAKDFNQTVLNFLLNS